MPTYDKLDEYVPRTGNFKNVNGDGTTALDTDLVVIEADQSSHLTNLRITAESPELYDVVVRDQDGSNPTVEKSIYGSDLDEGDFEEPVVREIGANKEVAIINRAQLPSEDIAVNLVLHELDLTSPA